MQEKIAIIDLEIWKLKLLIFSCEFLRRKNNNVQAEYKDEILNLTLPKAESESR